MTLLEIALTAAFAILGAAEAALNSSHVQATFVSPAEDLGFGLTVPNDSDDDIYFTLAAPAGISWAAIGLGSDNMQGALVLMTYMSGSGSSVTFSPRLATGHSEPVYFPELIVETLNGTGVFDDIYYYSGRCANCRSWPGGQIDVKSTSQKFIFATGPDGYATSDDLDAALKFHANYGSFAMDMVHATGPAGIPQISAATNVSDGATLTRDEEDKRDWASALHAVIMIGTFVGLMPLGVIILRLGGWVKWHGLNQALSLLGVLIGFGLGVDISLLYNRSKSFRNPHQIIGIIVLILVLGQFILGFTHHRIYKRTQEPTKLAPIHVWLGRLVIFLGILNGFLGFPLALAPRYNYILAGLVIAIAPVIFLMLFLRNFLRRRFGMNRGVEPSAGDHPEPWRNPAVPAETPASHDGGSDSPYAPRARGGAAQDIGLTTFETHHMTTNKDERRSDRTEVRDGAGSIGLGVQATPREYV